MLSRIAFMCAAFTALVSPWFFGAWEQWWFWPFAAVIFLAGSLTGLFLVRAYRHERHRGRLPDTSILDLYSDESRLASIAYWSFAPFLLYAFIRVLDAKVYMDAERSILLHLTPLILSASIVVTCGTKRLETFYRMIMINLLLIGLYSLGNHWITGSKLVLWAQGYESYMVESRMTGTYFCPDHFAGIMEIAFAMALGLFMTREASTRSRLFCGVIMVLSTFCVIMSKSRGGGLTLLVVVACALAFGLGQWRTARRWQIRGVTAAVSIIALFILWNSNVHYIQRFKVHFGLDATEGKSVTQVIDTAKVMLLDSCRGRMYAGAVRAWKSSNMLIGIGPGMHQHLWPHFSASNDGDIASGTWPTVTNYDFHSYEVHSDWLQLLEEYGTIGLLLFCIPLMTILIIHIKGLHHEAKRRKRRNWEPSGEEKYGYILGGLLSAIAMIFHSLGDFNLQIPATVWLLGAVMTLSTALCIVSIYGSHRTKDAK